MSAEAISTRSLLLAGAGAFVAWCVYFDHKRRSAPDFQAKVTEKRQAIAEAAAAAAPPKKTASGGMGAGGLGMPFDPQDPAQVKEFFLREMSTGQQLLKAGKAEIAVKHLANALRVYSEQQQLLGIFQQQMSPEVFQLLIKELQQ